MRIGIDVRPLAQRGGGIKRYTENLLRALARVDRTNGYVLYGRVDPDQRPVLGRRFSWTGSDFLLKRWLDNFYLTGDARNVELFHGTNYSAPILNSFPFILTVHDLTVHLLPRTHPITRRLRHQFLPSLCRRAARIIADSYNTKADLVRHYQVAAEKIDVVHLAAGDEFRPVRSEHELHRVRRRYGLPASFVLFVGSVEPRKNLPALIRAFAPLVREGLPLGLVIAGDGSRRYVQQLQRLVQSEALELGRDVIFTGHVADGDLAALYTQCELFAYPSLYEGFGLPPIEAMACGAPTLLSGNSSLREVYQGCSTIVDLAKSGALTDAIRRLVQNPALRSEQSEIGLKQARSRSWDDVAEDTLAVYRRAAGSD